MADSMKDITKMQDELKVLVGDELMSVSYKWAARHFQIHVNLAKQLLFAFAEQHRSKVNTTYLLAGWTKDSEKRHIFELVHGKDLQDKKNNLDPVTSLHVYSVQPSMPKGPADLWNTESQQTAELYDKLLEGKEENCLSDNQLSAVCCSEVTRDLDLSGKIKAPPPAAAEPVVTAEKAGTFAAKIDGVMAGSTGAKKGIASASVAVNGDKREAALRAGSASAPAAVPAKGVTTAKPAVKASGKAKASQLNSMWTNAHGSKQKKPVVAAQRKPSVTAAKQEVKAPAQGESSDEELADVRMPKRKAKAAVIEDDSDVEAEEAAAAEQQPKGGQRSRRVVKKARASMVESSESEDEDDSGAPEEPEATAVRKDSGGAETAQPMETEQEKPPPEGAVHQRPGSGTIKSGKPGGAQRRKVIKTRINDKGEEITEEVWEPQSEGEPGGSAPEDSEGQPGGRVEGAPKAEAKKSAPAKAALKKPSPAKGGGKKGAKSKPAPAGQKSLMSFFQKK